MAKGHSVLLDFLLDCTDMATDFTAKINRIRKTVISVLLAHETLTVLLVE
jgi:hypothetical protein